MLGGFLTTNFSWRWAFGINVIVAPLAIVGAVVFIHRDERKAVRTSIDVPGACLVALGMFLLVFGLSEGGRYGWFRPLEPLSVAGAEVWPRDLAVSLVPLAMLLGVVVLFAFYRLERAKERADADPLFEFGQLRHRTFRYGLVTTLVLAMGQLGVFFVLPVFLQDAKLLSAETNGFWMLPSGVAIIVGSQIGGFMARRVSTVRIVQLGLMISVAGDRRHRGHGRARHVVLAAGGRDLRVRARPRAVELAARRASCCRRSPPPRPAWRAGRTRPCARWAPRWASR